MPKTIIRFTHRVYGEISFTNPVLVALIQTPLFKRLKALAQLGTLRIWKHHKEHNRYNHSIGVAYLISYLFKHNPSFRHLSAKVKLETIVAGLLHDLGHGPFSHDFEKLFFPFKHEKQGISLILDPTLPIATILKAAKLDLKRITNLILGKVPTDFAQNLISSQFDCDRLDYLLNDPYYLNAPLREPIAWKKILEGLVLDRQRKQIYFPFKALKAVENYLQARYYLHKYQFWSDNHLLISGCFQKFFARLNDLVAARRLAKNQLKPFAHLWASTPLIPATAFLKWTDLNLIQWMKAVSEELKDPILTFFLTNFLQPYQKENRVLLRRFRFLRKANQKDLQKYRYLNFTFKVWSYQSIGKPPILFLNQKSQKVFRLEQISELFMKTLRIEEEHRFWLW